MDSKRAPQLPERMTVHSYDTGHTHDETLILSSSLETDSTLYQSIIDQLGRGNRTLYLELNEDAVLVHQEGDKQRQIRVSEGTALKVTQASSMQDAETSAVTGLELTLEDQKGTEFVYRTGQREKEVRVNIEPYRLSDVVDQTLLTAEELRDSVELQSSAIASFLENPDVLFLTFLDSGFLVADGVRHPIPTGEETAFKVIQMITMSTIMGKPPEPSD